MGMREILTECVRRALRKESENLSTMLSKICNIWQKKVHNVMQSILLITKRYQLKTAVNHPIQERVVQKETLAVLCDLWSPQTISPKQRLTMCTRLTGQKATLPMHRKRVGQPTALGLKCCPDPSQSVCREHLCQIPRSLETHLLWSHEKQSLYLQRRDPQCPR
jgi:hypothetical protein